MTHQTTGQPRDDRKIILQGDKVYYEKIKFLGDGSYSTVSLYRKTDEETQQKSYVALKKLKFQNDTGLQPSKSEMKQLINEIQILSIMDHENIIKYYGSFELNNSFYIETEFANAGTLEQFLGTLSDPLEEIEILVLFVQIASAVNYIHSYCIIHRDIKTSNIFLNSEGFIKLGDFGIAKMIDSQNEAKTFVGTPYYISPEIFKGKNYSFPVDIWALGCVLYEMASLTRTFDADKYSVLRNKIIKGDYLPIYNKYSNDFQKLMKSMLQKNPAKRSDSKEILTKTVDLINSLTSLELQNVKWGTIREIYPTNSLTQYIKTKSAISLTKSSLFRFDIFANELCLTSVAFDRPIHLIQMCRGYEHNVCLTKDNILFSWGNGYKGQLGLGDIKAVDKPTVIRSLHNYSIKKIAAGNDFTLFLLKTGLVMITGSAVSNCLGTVWATRDVFLPTIIDTLIRFNVIDIDCGPKHVVAITSEGMALAWGHNEFGQLGIGNTSQKLVVEPIPVLMPNEVVFKKVFCGEDCTVLVDSEGTAWACGNNEHNKLALNRHTLFHKREISEVAFLKKIKLFAKVKIIDVKLGKHHSIFIVENYKAYFTGSNLDAQLGIENVCPVYKPVLGLKFTEFSKLVVGSRFSMALNGNSVLFWGTRRLEYDDEGSRNKFYERQFSRTPTNPTQSSTKFSDFVTKFRESRTNFIIGGSNDTLMKLVQLHGPDRPILKMFEPKIVVETMKELSIINTSNTVVLKPQCVLHLYSSKTYQDADVSISNLFCFRDDSVYVVLDANFSDFPTLDDCVVNNFDDFGPINENDAQTVNSESKYLFLQVSANQRTIEPEQVGFMLNALDLTVTDVELQKLIIQMKSFQSPQDDGITFDMFYKVIHVEIDYIRKQSETRAVFEELANTRTGRITPESLELFFRKKLGEKFDLSCFVEMLNGRKEINYKEFCAMMNQIFIDRSHTNGIVKKRSHPLSNHHDDNHDNNHDNNSQN